MITSEEKFFFVCSLLMGSGTTILGFYYWPFGTIIIPFGFIALSFPLILLHKYKEGVKG